MVAFRSRIPPVNGHRPAAGDVAAATSWSGWIMADAGREQDCLADLEVGILERLKTNANPSCRALAFRRKGSKLLVEFESASTNGAGTCLERWIGKVYREDRAGPVFDLQSQLWNAGFRPPSPFTVVRPIAYLKDRRLLLQEKAPGCPVADIVLGGAGGALDLLVRTASWLAALQSAPVQPESRLDAIQAGVARYARGLMESLPRFALRIRRVMECALSQLENGPFDALVPSHGDLHPKNLFVADDGRISAIDLDTFGLQERVADVAYFLTQTAIMGHFHCGSFAATHRARRCFLRAYEQVAKPLSRRRLGLYMGMALLQSLHYELCVFRNGKTEIIEPWVANAERCVLDGRATLLEGRALNAWRRVSGRIGAVA